ncbi:uncharacterized protein LOC131208728 [Anopheles bellator]|uniref:uncharacterized protein LOC131208728 n=1 Tax=Anopheles bellator TaxID=139047 RepID=UPI00264996BC|nr:uncharacterized protein LOC131208728 [Anopheles bellator]
MNGLSTLNRLLGKRNKDVSKSTSNLSRSSTNLDASSQYNSKVTQLPIVPNAPFEQTFRVTVLLPRDQLYVARIGAKTKLSTLLDQVCSDKLLDAQKYVFRHPADFQHGFELDMNIGEVGLSEIRLMSRKELEALRNSDYRLSTSDIFRMHQKTARETTTGGTSLSSSDLSRTSKLAPKTTSPYSSTNSLNSMDSSGVSSSSRGGGGTNGGHAGNGHHHHNHQQPQQQPAAPPVAPTRKKRAAPRPPSQNSIPEARPIVQHTPNGANDEKQPPEDPSIFKEPQLPPYSRQNFHVSTPNLYDREPKAVDILNNNSSTGNGSDKQNGYAIVETNNNNNNHVMTSAMVLEEEDRKNLLNTKTSFSTLKNRPTSMYIIREPESAPLQRSSENGGSMMDINHSRASSSCSDAKDPRDFQDMPEPTPRKRLNSNAKKSKAPAPPPRAKMVITPVPTPSPRALTRSTLDLLRDNDVAISETDSNFSSEPDDTHRNRESRLNAVNGSVHRAPALSVANAAVQQNVSKVMLNVEQTPNGTPAANGVEKKHQKTGSTSSVSIKIGGPADQPSAPQLSSKPTTPIVSKVQIGSGQQPETPSSSPGDNSSDEEIKIYNIESGKAMIKKKVCPGPEHKIEVATKPATNGAHNGTGRMESQPNGGGGAADEEQWTYTLPAPPKFADSSIKANDYDERHQFYRPASTFVDNTTLRTDMLTVMSDETVDRIKPFFQERLQAMELNLPSERRPGAESPTSDTTTHVSDSGVPHISSDLEDGYRVGADGGDRTQPPVLNTTEDTREAREVWLQTLEKRREKIIESELATLSESIGGKQSTVAPAPRLVSPPEAVIERKSSVMNELNQLLRDGVELSRKEDTDIAVAANRSSLANFKISTYSSENKENIVTSTTTTIIEQQQEVIVHKATQEDPTDGSKHLKQTEPITLALEEEAKEPIADVIVYRKTSADAGTRKAHSLTQSSDEDDGTHRHSNGYQAGSAKKELAPVKRRSLTMLNKSPRVINRSDSFHSTRSDYIQSLNSPVQPVPTTGSKLHLTPRSTSYISLIGAQRWENRASVNGGLATSFSRRKSTSELSICDSPSLQSLEVIKNILNTSRKNSINNLHHAAATTGGATEQNGLGAGLGEEIALPSMAAIKRNSFTDISTLAQLNGKVVQLNGVASGVSVRKDSIEEAKAEEQEQEQEPEPKPAPDQDEVKPQVKPVELCVVEKEALDVVEKPKEEPEIVKGVEEQKEPIKLVSGSEEGNPKASIQDLASESKSDDEKLLQNKHQQQQQSVVKEPQTTVVSITTTSTVVSSSSSNASVDKPSNDTDTKKWTYQGPPTISFATWNERPKIDVSIKSDRDYRFGGSSTLPRGFRNVNNVSSTKISIGPGGSSTTETTTSVRRTIHEVVDQGRDDTEQTASNVPLKASQERQETVVAVTARLASAGASAPKPIAVHSTSLTTIGGSSTTTTPSPPGERLPIVRAVEYKKNVVQRQPPPPVEPKPSYFYETFSRSDTNNSISTTSSIGNVSSVSVNGSGSSGSTTTTTISRLSLGPKPANMLQPTVRGFKSLDEATVATSTTTISGPRLRPVSMIDTSVLRKSTTPIVPSTEEVPTHSLPFSQHTLRRTGLKEKILAKDPAPARVESATVPAPVAGTTNVVNGGAAVEPPIPAPTRPVTLTASMPSPPPPPPTLQATVAPVSLKPTQPVVRGAIVKKSPANPAGGAPVIDPRTALLDAIRGFNKNSLRK